MMRSIVTLLLLLVTASAFTHTSPWGSKLHSVVHKDERLFMFNAGNDEKPKPLESVDTPKPLETVEIKQGESSELEEVKAPAAATEMDWIQREQAIASRDFEMEWWAWLFFVALPVTVLTNDVFHFLPTEGPLGFIGRL